MSCNEWRRTWNITSRLFLLVLLSANRFSLSALIKSDNYCLPTSPNTNDRINGTKDDIELACPMPPSIVNVFELRFMVNASCRDSVDPSGRENRDFESKHSSTTCQAKSIRGSNLLTCIGHSCSLRQIKSIKVCGRDANQIYALYECIPVVLERSVVWSRNGIDKDTNIAKSEKSDYNNIRKLTCPQDTSIVVTEALAIVGPLANPQCVSHEPFTTQVARMCCSTCSICNVSMIAPGLRCKQRLMRNEYSVVNYSCIPRIDNFRDIRQYTLCETTRIESNSPTSGFIVNQNYPKSYPPNMQCNMTLSSSLPMNLYLLSFDVIYPHSLSVKLKTANPRQIKLYAKDKLPRLLVRNASELTLEFLSNFIAGKGNVMLYFSSSPPLEELELWQASQGERFPKTPMLVQQNENQQSLLFETYGRFYVPKPVLIYILAAATLTLVLSSLSLLIATFMCPVHRNTFKRHYTRNSHSEPISQESNQKLLLDYGTYEELSNHLPVYSYADERGTNHHVKPFGTFQYCSHCCPHCYMTVIKKIPYFNTNAIGWTSQSPSPLHYAKNHSFAVVTDSKRAIQNDDQ